MSVFRYTSEEGDSIFKKRGVMRINYKHSSNLKINILISAINVAY